QDEDGSRDGRVERRRETRTGPRREEESGALRIQASPARERPSRRGAHLHGRSLAAQRETSGDRQRAGGELDDERTRPGELPPPRERRLHLRDAAAGAVRLEPQDEPDRRTGQKRRAQHRKRDSVEKRTELLEEFPRARRQKQRLFERPREQAGREARRDRPCVETQI